MLQQFKASWVSVCLSLFDADCPHIDCELSDKDKGVFTKKQDFFKKNSNFSLTPTKLHFFRLSFSKSPEVLSTAPNGALRKSHHPKKSPCSSLVRGEKSNCPLSYAEGQVREKKI